MRVKMCRIQTGDKFKAQQFRLPNWLQQLVTGWRLRLPLTLLFIATCLDMSASLLVFEGLGQRLAALPYFILATQQVSIIYSPFICILSMSYQYYSAT